MFKDAARLSWVGLVNQVLPSRDSCWLAYANGVIMSLSLSLVEGIVQQTIVLPKICSMQQQQQLQQQWSSLGQPLQWSS